MKRETETPLAQFPDLCPYLASIVIWIRAESLA